MFSLAKLSPSITDMIRFDHSYVFLAFHQFNQDKQPSVRKALADTICTALEIHVTLAEAIFYPAMHAVDPDDPVLARAPHEHGEMKRLIRELRAIPGDDARHDRVLLELMREVIHHVADEETVLLPIAEQKLSEYILRELGAQMSRRRVALQASQAGKVAVNTALGLSGNTTTWVVGAVGAVLAVAVASSKRPAEA
ncbi:hemerythrin domain-containing protein [Massilia sp. S19_KUP03_FR1]|uniref:hemerythrin domain-containing protein n=1 Tax=Massilia sp. S19_KUP03_FR1 TaxID=3025503 RepID=UPI002FCDA103